MHIHRRIATKKAKPDGQYQITTENMDESILELALHDLPGVGGKKSKLLASKGLHRVGDLLSLSKPALQELAGSSLGAFLYLACRGIDDKPLVSCPSRSSVSIDVNWGLRFDSMVKAERFIGDLAAECSSRLVDAGVSGGRNLTVKILKRRPGEGEPAKFMGCGVCDAFSKSVTIRKPLLQPEDLEAVFIPLFRKLVADMPLSDLRGLGVQVDKFEEQTNSRSLQSWFKPQESHQAHEELSSKVIDISNEDEEDEVQFIPAVANITSSAFIDNEDSNLSASQIEFLSSLPPDLLKEQLQLLKSTANPSKHASPSKVAKRKSPNKFGAKNEASSLFDFVKSNGKKQCTQLLRVAGRASEKDCSNNGLYKYFNGENSYSQNSMESFVSVEISLDESVLVDSALTVAQVPPKAFVLALEKWVISSTAPSLDDLQLLMNYANELIETLQLDKLRDLLVTIRKVETEWAKQLEVSMQHSVIAKFGCPIQ